MPTGFQQVTRHSVAKGNPNVLKCLKHETGEGTLMLQISQVPPFLTEACYRGIGRPCLSRAALSFSTLIFARKSSSSSSCFLFRPSRFSSRYNATFL